MSAERVVLTQPSEAVANYGRTNSEGDLIVSQNDVINDPKGASYTVLRMLGRGQYGQVFHVRETGEAGRQFAMKISKMYAQLRSTAVHEAETLQLLQKNATEEEATRFSRLENTFLFHNHFCIVMELLSCDLYQVLVSREFMGLSLRVVQNIAKSMLQMLVLLERCGVVHSDIKPENLVMTPGPVKRVKMIDFGSARTLDLPCSFYIQSRYYRAPEVVLGIPHGTAVDMWSLGCVLFEMFLGLPLFPGQSAVQLLCIIVEMIGQFPPEVVSASPRQNELFLPDGRMKSEEQICREKGTTPAKRFRCFAFNNMVEIVMRFERFDDNARTPEEKRIQHQHRRLFADFLLKTLALDQNHRIKPADALRDPFITTDLSARGTPC